MKKIYAFLLVGAMISVSSCKKELSTIAAENKDKAIFPTTQKDKGKVILIKEVGSI